VNKELREIQQECAVKEIDEQNNRHMRSIKQEIKNAQRNTDNKELREQDKDSN